LNIGNYFGTLSFPTCIVNINTNSGKGV